MRGMELATGVGELTLEFVLADVDEPRRVDHVGGEVVNHGYLIDQPVS